MELYFKRFDIKLLVIIINIIFLFKPLKIYSDEKVKGEDLINNMAYKIEKRNKVLKIKKRFIDESEIIIQKKIINDKEMKKLEKIKKEYYNFIEDVMYELDDEEIAFLNKDLNFMEKYLLEIEKRFYDKIKIKIFFEEIERKRSEIGVEYDELKKRSTYIKEENKDFFNIIKDEKNDIQSKKIYDFYIKQLEGFILKKDISKDELKEAYMMKKDFNNLSQEYFKYFTEQEKTKIKGLIENIEKILIENNFDGEEIDYTIQVKVLYEEGEYDKAIEIIENKNLQDTDTLYIKAKCYEKKGETEKTIKIYRELLLKDETLLKIRMELVNLYLNISKEKIKDAKKELEMILSSVKDKELKNIIEKILIELKEKEEKKRWIFSLYSQIEYNDNINKGSIFESMLMPNGKIEKVSEDYKVKSDIGLNFYIFSQYNFKNAAIFGGYARTAYTKYKEESYEKAYFSIFPEFKIKNIKVEMPLETYFNIKNGADEENTYSLYLKPNFQYSDFIKYKIFLGYEYKNNRVDIFKSNIFKCGTELIASIKMIDKFELKLSASVEQSTEDYLGNKGIELNINLSKKIFADCETDLNYNFLYTAYDIQEANFGIIRNDIKNSVNVFFRKKFKKYDFNTGVSYKFILNNSSLDYYKYQNNIFGFEINKNF